MRRVLRDGLLLAVGLMAGAVWVGSVEAQQPVLADPVVAAPVAHNALRPGAVEYNLYIPPQNPSAAKVVEKLDALGAQGWRLAGTTTSNGGTSGFIFIRDRR